MLDDAGNVTERYLYGPDVDQLLAVDIAHETMWTLADNLGSVRAIVAIDDQTGDGHVIQRFSYTAFGQVQVILNDRTDIDIRFLYTGREWDADADLYHYRRRWYDPALQKFISEDPLGFAAGDDNITRYVANRATNATDPSGLLEITDKNSLNAWEDAKRKLTILSQAQSNAVQTTFMHFIEGLRRFRVFLGNDVEFLWWVKSLVDSAVPSVLSPDQLEVGNLTR